jgi:hypothetical protein
MWTHTTARAVWVKHLKLSCGRGFLCQTSGPHCTNECEIAKRNTRLTETFGINPDIQKMNHNIVYSDKLIAFARHNGKFVELVEKTFAEYVLKI